MYGERVCVKDCPPDFEFEPEHKYCFEVEHNQT